MANIIAVNQSAVGRMVNDVNVNAMRLRNKYTVQRPGYTDMPSEKSMQEAFKWLNNAIYHIGTDARLDTEGFNDIVNMYLSADKKTQASAGALAGSTAAATSSRGFAQPHTSQRGGGAEFLQRHTPQNTATSQTRFNNKYLTKVHNNIPLTKTKLTTAPYVTNGQKAPIMACHTTPQGPVFRNANPNSVPLTNAQLDQMIAAGK